MEFHYQRPRQSLSTKTTAPSEYRNQLNNFTFTKHLVPAPVMPLQLNFYVFSNKKQYLEKIATLADELKVLQAENKNLHEQATKLHEKHHSTTLQVRVYP